MLRYKTETRPGLVALYDIRPGNGAGPFLQPRSPRGAWRLLDLPWGEGRQTFWTEMVISKSCSARQRTLTGGKNWTNNFKWLVITLNQLIILCISQQMKMQMKHVRVIAEILSTKATDSQVSSSAKLEPCIFCCTTLFMSIQRRHFIQVISMELMFTLAATDLMH